MRTAFNLFCALCVAYTLIDLIVSVVAFRWLKNRSQLTRRLGWSLRRALREALQ